MIALILQVGFVCTSGIRLFQVEDEKREAEREVQAVELNSLESLLYKFRRDDVVKQNQPLFDKLNASLKWVEDVGQFAGLDETTKKVEEIKENVSFVVSIHDALGNFAKTSTCKKHLCR